MRKDRRPSSGSQRHKPLFDVERIGFAKFVQGRGQRNKDGVWSSDTDPPAPAKTLDELGPSVGELAKQVVSRGVRVSSGPVEAEDVKLWMTCLVICAMLLVSTFCVLSEEPVTTFLTKCIDVLKLLA